MTKRSYGQACNLARALDLIGDRWTLLIVRELLLGPRRYRDLQHNLPGMGTNLLADRLKELESANLIERVPATESGARKAYRLTTTGRALEESVHALVRWGAGVFAEDDEEQPVSRPEWDLIAMRALFRPDKAAGLNLRVQLEIEGLACCARVEDGELTVGTGYIEKPEVTLKTDRPTLSRLHRRTPVTTRPRIGGDPGKLEEFLEVFR